MDNQTSNPAPNELYESLFKNKILIELAAINIERDITKCLTCHGLFTINLIEMC